MHSTALPRFQRRVAFYQTRGQSVLRKVVIIYLGALLKIFCERNTFEYSQVYAVRVRGLIYNDRLIIFLRSSKMKEKNTSMDIPAIRQKLGLNQQQFWARLGVTQSGGSRYENGR